MITTQKEFFATIAKKSGKSQKEVKEIYTAIVDTIVESANTDDETSTILPLIGKVNVRIDSAKTARNPKTGEIVEVPAKRRARVRTFPAFQKNFAE
jgi:DNA-binding protein HU-beta